MTASWQNLDVALIISRVIRPTSKLSTLAWWADSTLGADLDVADASTDEIYAAMDWLADRQDAIEKKLAATHLGPDVNSSRIVRHRDAIDAALDHGLSQGPIESTNTKIRLLTRIAFGFRSADALIALAMLALGGHRPALPSRTKHPRISQ